MLTFFIAGLLGGGPNREWEHLVIPEIDSSSDQESVDDVWSINDEQREYYIRQFQNIEPDINGQITGTATLEHFVANFVIHKFSELVTIHATVWQSGKGCRLLLLHKILCHTLSTAMF